MMKTRIYTLLAALLLTAASTYAQTKIATTISVAVDNANGITAGEDARVTVSLTDANNNGVTGIATISVKAEGGDAKYYDVAVVEGKGTFNVTNLGSASYAITASFAGDDVYAASETAEAYSLYVPKITTGLNISIDKTEMHVSETATVSIQLNKTGYTNAEGGVTALETPVVLSNNAVVSIRINSQNSEGTSVPLVNGKGAYELIGFAEGTYVIDVDYAGDDKKYVNSGTQGIKTLTLTVSKQETTISVSDIAEIKEGEDATITVTATPAIVGFATVTVDDTEYNVALVNGTGTCYVPNLTAGTYDVTVSIAEDDKYLGSTDTKQVTVNEGNPIVESNAVATVTVTPTDYTGNVTVTIDGENYNVAVINGTGKVVLPQLAAGTYAISASIADDGKYAACTNEDAVLVSVTGVTFPFATGQTWATWCDDWAWKKPEGVTAYTISAVSGNTVTIAEVTGNEIPSHTPLLLKKTGEAVTPTSVKAATGTDALVSTAATGATFYGNACDTKITEGYNYAIGQSYGLYNGEFVLIDTENGIAANRCMLNVTTSGNQAPTRLTISKDGDATGITTTDYTDLTDSDGSWYSLDGRKLNGKPTQKGVYIYKGVKRVVK
jgi:hypothetical protein